MNVAAQLIASSESRIVVGLGATGVSCARYLHARGLPFVVIDTREQPPGLEAFRREMPDVTVYAGQYPEEIVTGATELIVSPGVAMDDPVVAQALAAEVAVCGDIDLFMREVTVPVVGITGSNAKSTVTELVGAMARDAGRDVGVGGNLGTPALELLERDCELYILELSSFQLERAGTLGLQVATVLNVSADHLDRHHSMPAYHRAKHRIFFGCQAAVFNRDDALTFPLLPPDVTQVSWRLGEPDLDGFGLRTIDGQEMLCLGFEPLLAASELTLAGRHNLGNALAALALGHCIGLPLDAMANTLRTFRGLPHRCEPVVEIDQVRYIDDSKGTNIGATCAALAGLGGEGNVVLIAGGQGKGADFTELRGPVAAHCRVVVLIGEDAPLIREALQGTVTLEGASSMADAVERAAALAHPGDVVLLSPACASFDMFSGYVARGQAFREASLALQGSAQ